MSEKKNLAHVVDPLGIRLVAVDPSGSGNVFGAHPLNLQFGEEFEITPELLDRNRDRLGRTWLELDEAGQTDAFGSVRFRRGPATPDVAARVRELRREALLERRRDLIAGSTAARRADAATGYLAQLDAELAALDAEGQNS